MAAIEHFDGLIPFSARAMLIDVPWGFQNYSEKGEAKNPNQHYETMTDDEILAMPVGHLLAGDGAAFVWTVDPKLDFAFECIKKWGLVYKTVAFYWFKRSKHGKEHLGPGYWTRANPEICLLAVNGRPERLSTGVRRVIETVEDWPKEIDARVREHSRKPDEVRDRIRQLVPGPYVELFARQHYPGWTCWGNQAGKFDEDIV